MLAVMRRESPPRKPRGEQPGWVVASALSKSFGRIQAVDALSFSAPPGSVTAFLGPNGAGKSTTLRMLVGLVTPDAGVATISGRPYVALAAPTREVGTVLEDQAFHPARNGRDHLLVYCAACGYPSTRADELVELVGLTEAARRKVGHYSLGMRQRLALATALLGDPPVLVLDEPANGLDPAGVVWMRGLLRDFVGRGGTVLFSSHVLSEVEVLADRVVIVARGRLVGEGTLADLIAERESVSVGTNDSDRLLVALQAAGAIAVRTGSGRISVSGLRELEISRIADVHGIEVHELVGQRSNLERVFLTLTSGEAGEPPGSAPASSSPR